MCTPASSSSSRCTSPDASREQLERMFASAAHARSCEEEVLLLSVPSLSWQMVSFFVRGFGREKDGRCCCRTCRSRFMSLESKDAIAAIVCCLITCCCLRTKQKRRFWGEFSLTRLSRACLGKCLDLHEQMVQTRRLGFAPRPRHRSLCELGQVHHRLPDRVVRERFGAVLAVQRERLHHNFEVAPPRFGRFKK